MQRSRADNQPRSICSDVSTRQSVSTRPVGDKPRISLIASPFKGKPETYLALISHKASFFFFFFFFMCLLIFMDYNTVYNKSVINQGNQSWTGEEKKKKKN